MRTRIITAAVYMCLFLPALIFSDTWILPAELAVIVAMSVFEMLRCIGVWRKPAISVPVMAVSVVMPILTRLSMSVEVIKPIPLAFGLILVFLLYLFAMAVFGVKRFSIEEAALTFMTVIYITVGYSSVVFVRDFSVTGSTGAIDNVGKYIFLLAFVGAWVTDTFAYFGGRLLGKHKLCPDISPKKTVEGSISGVIFCIISFIIYGVILEKCFGQRVDYLVLAAVGLVASVVAQIGDLTLSLIKRRFGIKDYGKSMPGHGGFLDRFDSVIPVAIALAVICELLTVLNVNVIEGIL